MKKEHQAPKEAEKKIESLNEEIKTPVEQDNKQVATEKETSPKEEKEPIKIKEESAKEDSKEKKEIENLKKEIISLKEKNEKANKDLLLAMAEFDNYRKRTLREKAELIKSGGESCLISLLPIIDDFERGLQAVKESTDIEAVKEGLDIIYNKFKNYLEQQGVKEIETIDKPFDTEFHEAITTLPATTPDQVGKVVECVQKGYQLGNKVIRFPKVVVAG